MDNKNPKDNRWAIYDFLAVLILIAGIFLLAIAYKNKSLFIDEQNNNSPPDNPINKMTLSEDICTFSDIENEIKNHLKNPQIEPELLANLLWEYSNYNKSIDDISRQLDISLFISKTYIAFDGKIEDALELALDEIAYSDSLIAGCSQDKTKYRKENLSMLSTIYQLLGIRCTDKREHYYQKASECIEELLPYYENNQDKMYESKLLDIITMAEDMGDYEKSILRIEKYMQSADEVSPEILIKYLLLLTKKSGNEERVLTLLEKIDGEELIKEDFRYEEIVKICRDYIKE